MRRFNKLLKSGTSLMLVFAMLLGMCSTAIAVGETKSTENSYVALGDFVTEDALAAFAEGTVVYGGFKRIVDLYNDDLNANLEAIKAADVIALGIGNADINIYAVNNILGAIGADAVGFDSAICDDEWKNLDTALENCDALTRNIALQLYDKLEPVVSEKLSDNAMIETVLDVLVYTAVSFVVNYSAVLEEVATVNPDATVMIVGLVNMMNGMKVNFNGQELDLGLYIGYVMEALNGYLAAVPTMMQMNGEYEGVTFLYAEASDAEVEYVKPALNYELRDRIIDAVNEFVFPALWERISIPEQVNGITVDITLSETVTVDMVNNYDNLTDAGEIIPCAIYLAFESAIINADEPTLLSLDMEGGIDGVLSGLNLDIDMSTLADDVMAAVLAYYEAWQWMDAEAEDSITEACYNFMLGKVEEMVKEQQVEDMTIAEAYLELLNTVIAEINDQGEEFGIVAEEIPALDWNVLWNSLISEEYATEARTLFETLMADAKETLGEIAWEIALETLVEENLDEAVATAQQELYEEAMLELDAVVEEALNEAVDEILAEEYDMTRQEAEQVEGLIDSIIEQLIAEGLVEEVEAEYEASVRAEIYDNEENVKKLTEEVEKAILDEANNSEEFAAAVAEEVEKQWNALWNTAWDEALCELYTTVNEKYNEGVALLDENKANLPLALLKIADQFVTLPTEPVNVKAWVLEMREELEKQKDTMDALVNAWANEVAAELIIEKIDEVLPEVFAGDDMNSLLYLLGRLLVGDGLGRYITPDGSDAIYYAMVAAYGDGEDDTQNTVQNEISNKVEKLIDLVLQYGPKAMNKVGAIEKLRHALDVMVEKLDDRGGAQVDKAVNEIESILDEIEAIANGETDKTAEDLVNAYINLDATIEELRALINGEEIDEESEGAIREFIDAAAHGGYEIDYKSHYVAVGDDSVEGYAGLLAAELGLSGDYDTVVSENVAASIENLDAEVIEKADLITVGFSGNTFLQYMAAQMNARMNNEQPDEMDWATYVGDAGVKYVEKALNEIQAVLAKDLHTGFGEYYLDEVLMLAVESYAYAAADYALNYPVLLEEIRAINPDALIVCVGMNNSAANIELNLTTGYEEFALGQYIGYVIAAVNGEAKAYAMLNENVAYVHAPDVAIEAGDENPYATLWALLGGIMDEFAALTTTDEGKEYIKTKIYDALNITHGLRLGDINFDEEVDLVDLDMLYEYLIGRLELTGEQLYVADVDGVDGVTPADLTILYDYLIGRNTILA